MLRKFANFALLALLVVPAVSYALGLGEIRVSSALNQPLEAEISLTSVRAGELDGLQIRLAPQEAFNRVGLDRPFVLTQLRFEVGEDARGQPVVKVSTVEAVREPFLNFLVEATWARGRLLREFTVLLDPPVLMPATIAPVRVPDSRPASPPRTQSFQASEPTQSRFPEERYRASAGTFGPVQRGDTLWAIADQVRPDGISTSQMMLAILDANPEAFEGNINRMRAGYVLRIPDRGVVARRSAAEAMGEVTRQNQAWRSGEAVEGRIAQAGPASSDARLRLRAPDSTQAGTDPAGGVGATGDSELSQQLSAARQQVEDERVARESLAERLVDLESEAADLRRRLELREAELAAIGQAPAAEPAATPAQPERRPPPPVEQSPADPGMMGLLANPLVLAVLLGVPVIGAIVFLALRRRREASAASMALGTSDSLDHDDDEATQFDVAVDGDRTQVAGAAAAAPSVDSAPTPKAASKPAPAPEPEPADDPMSASTIIELDENDPTSEADFHLAYGLYDQAAELMEEAVQQQPDRVPFRMKLLEIYFTWGKADEYIRHAGAGKAGLQDAGEWGTVAIMGRQLSPDEALFSGDGGMSSTKDALDLGATDDEPAAPAADDDFTSAFDEPEPAQDDGGMLDMDFGMETDVVPAAAAKPEAPAPAGNEMEFDLSDFELPEAEAAATSDGDVTTFNLDDMLGDDGADDSADSGTMEIDLDEALAGLDDDDKTSFNIEDDTGTDDIDEVSLDFESLLESDADSELEVSTGSDSRIDLARAYIDMGDSDGARSLLQEVLAEGNDDQKREAQELLDLIS